MKRLLTCLFLVLGLGLAFSVNTNADASLKSAMKINKKEKVKYSKYERGAVSYWDNIHLKINDLRGDGNVYYVFDVDRYYRVSEDYKVVSSGKLKYKSVKLGDHLKDWGIFELTEDNQVSYVSPPHSSTLFSPMYFETSCE